MNCENIIIAGCLSFGIISILIWVWLKMPIKNERASVVTEKNFFTHGFCYSVKTKDGLQHIPKTHTWIGLIYSSQKDGQQLRDTTIYVP